MFDDLKPILPEMYTPHDLHINTLISAKQISTKPQLISFDTSNTNSDKKPNYSRSTTTLHDQAADYSNNLTPQIIKFSSDHDQEVEDFAVNRISQDHKGVASTRTVLQAQDHLIAERKRREKQGQLFISLSKVVPGLKKLDKASLLEDAITYLKTLKERVSVLEVNKSAVVNNASSCIDNIAYGSTSEEEAGPEIKARSISNRNVLISICCDQKIKGLISRIPYELEKMHLNVVDMRAMPFGGAALYITILTQMQSEFRGTVKDIVDHLHMNIFFSNPAADDDDLAHFH